MTKKRICVSNRSHLPFPAEILLHLKSYFNISNMNKIITVVFSLMLFSGVNAQSLNIQIIDEAGNDVNNGYYAVPSVNQAAGSYTNIKFKLKNNGTEPLDIRVRRDNVQMPAGYNNTICIDGFCYPATSEESQFPLVLNAGAVDSSFYGTFNNPEGSTGDLCVTYTIFNNNDANQFVTVRAYFGTCLTASTEDHMNEVALLSAFPNPANGQVTIKHNLKSAGTLLITDITGKTVKNQRILAESTNATVDISDLKPGIYVYSLESGTKRMISKKLVVR
jgi:hypothetical protein